MSWLDVGAAVAGSLFGGGEDEAPSPAENIMSQAKGVRKAAEKYGFNPLTLLQYGQPAGAIGASGGPPPLASAEAISGLVRGVGDILSGEDAQRKAMNQAQLELAQIAIEKARAGGVVDALGNGAAPLGLGRAARVSSPQPVKPVEPFNVFRSLADPVVHQRGAGGGVAVPEPRLDRGSDAFALGFQLKAAPGFSSGQVIEDQYGDIGSAVYGPVKAIADVGYTIGDLVGQLVTKAEALAIRRQGGTVYKMGGKYYAQEPHKPAPPRYSDGRTYNTTGLPTNDLNPYSYQ